MFTFISSGLLIFTLRLVDVTFATLRIFMVMRGRKVQAWLFGFFQAMVYVLALGWVFSDLGNWTKILGYTTGFATGLIVGMILEDRLAIGFTNLRIISPSRGLETAEGLRKEGFAVTEVSAQGRDGAVSVLHCSVLRKYEKQVIQIISRLDPETFITVENVNLVQHGFWNH